MRKISFEKLLAQVFIYCLIFFWSLIFLVPSELQELEFGFLPVNWWSNIISIVMFGVVILVFLVSFFSRQFLSKFNWRTAVIWNPWFWSLLLVAYVAVSFLLRPNILGLNFALNLMILTIGLPYILMSFHLIGNWVLAIVTLLLVGGLASNWLYQVANQISYARNADIEFAHALSLLSLIILSVVSRTSHSWSTVAYQGVFFAAFFFLATTQLRLPAFIAGTFFILHSLWQVSPWRQRFLTALGNTLLVLTTWLFVVERVLFQQGSLYVSGREVFYQTVSSVERSFFELVFGRGPGATRTALFAELGYSNPHSSLLVMANDYGAIGGALALGLVVSLLVQIRRFTAGNKSGTGVFFASLALVASFGALSLFAEPVETTLVVLTALVVFLFNLLGMRVALGRSRLDTSSTIRE